MSGELEERYGRSPITGTWYRVTEWTDLGDGTMLAKEKEPVHESEVPPAWRGAFRWAVCTPGAEAEDGRGDCS